MLLSNKKNKPLNNLKINNIKLIENKNNQKVFDLVRRAINWLEQNEYKTPIVKWETKAWGEIPADFGRK